MLTAQNLEFSRNLGFISEEEQVRLNQSSVAIAGAGGDGGMLAVQLARLGVGELRLADPDPFEAENINRQACCTTKTVGVNKAEAVGQYVQEINPDIKVSIFDDGITEDNVEAFVRGSDIVLDETEFTLHALGVMLAREARKEGIPNLMAMNIGFGATVTTFAPRGSSFEKMLGISEKAPLNEVADMQPAISRWLPYLPSYADIEVFKKVATGEKSAPSIAPGVALAASIASTQTLLNLFEGKNRRLSPVTAPKLLMVDAMTGEAKKMRLSPITHHLSLGKMLVSNALRRSPSASY